MQLRDILSESFGDANSFNKTSYKPSREPKASDLAWLREYKCTRVLPPITDLNNLIRKSSMDAKLITESPVPSPNPNTTIGQDTGRKRGRPRKD
jgi:hypothetical protein